MTSYPQEFMCPITQDLMVSPVICRDGITYEESAIRQWLQFHNTSPVTREHLSALDLIPNRALKSTIEEYLKQNQIRISNNIVTSRKDNIITLTNEVTGNIIEGKYYVNIKVKPIIQQRKGVSLIVLLDISGSMGQSVSENVNCETDGFTRLDLIKHTMRTIIESLSDDDELCVIKFNSVATKICSFVKMTQINKLDINPKLDALYADGQTNIWDALRLAFDTIKTIDTDNRVGSIFLLTDGESNVNPPRGIVETLKTTYDFSKLHFTVNTFGYSYNVDSSLLYQISSLFGGIYGFIPDGTMVGTIFINALSNLLSSVSSSCKVKIESTNFKLCTNTNLGFMPNNQEKNILIEYSNKTSVNGNVVIVFDNKSYTIPLNYRESPNINVNVCFAKTNLITICRSINQTLTYSSNFITNLDKTTDYIKKLYLTDSFISDLVDDLDNVDPNRGQLKKSIQCADWYNKWGKHYLPSAIRSHELELCFNFKDAAPQHYTSDTFKTEQARIESIFCTIAPPRPTLKTTVQTQNMTSYYNQSGGCFSGNCNVLMADSTTKLVKEIKKGDKIKTLYGDAVIKCVIKLTYNKIIPISRINNLEITPFHPIYYENEWKFPQELCSSSESFMTELYDFVLDSHHIVNINNINVVCLGHGIKGPCVEHEYFGKYIIEDLENMYGWNDGYINLENFTFVRDPTTNLVIKLIS